jgi:hypothetical protein
MNFVRDLVVAVVLGLGLICIGVWALSNLPDEPSYAKFRAECAAANGKAVWNGKHMECWR